jgi:carboxyl-terminal processing protease
MTTDAYYTPNGVCIHDVGVTPDLIVELPEELNDLAIELLEPSQDTQLQVAIALFSQQSR